MSDFKSGARITVPGKKKSGEKLDYQSTEAIGVTETSNQSTKAEGDDNSADQSQDKAKALETLEGNDEKSKPAKDLVSICREFDIKDDVHGFYPFMSRDGKANVLMTDRGNLYAVGVKSKAYKSIVRKAFKQKGERLSRNQLNDIVEEIEAEAYDNGIMLDIYYRVAPVEGGFEYDSGNTEHTRYRVTAPGLEIVTAGSKAIFTRNNVMLETSISDGAGDLEALRPFVNLKAEEWILYKGAISYYLSHPKVPGVEYPILAFISEQGSGKSFLSHMTQCLVDNNTVGLQTLPRRIKDIVIAFNHTHLLSLDNLRYLGTQHADLFCVSSTSGSFIDRALWTDGEMNVSFVQCPVLLNGIHNFYDQPDLAERMLVLHPEVITSENRQSKARLQADFEAAFPVIFRGLLEYCEKVLKHLPTVGPSQPARMYDFSHWFAAMERAEDVPEGVYQESYKENLRQAQLDSLLENPLAAALVQFSESLMSEWKDEPLRLLEELNELVPRSVRYTQDWPSNSIALKKRLKPLQAGLRSQGIFFEFGRDKKRWIFVTTTIIKEQY